MTTHKLIKIKTIYDIKAYNRTLASTKPKNQDMTSEEKLLSTIKEVAEENMPTKSTVNKQ